MRVLAVALVSVVVISHLGFLVLEMFFWTAPLGLRIFGMSAEQAEASRVLAMNQGLYNGFLAFGLIWALWTRRLDLKLFFLGCVVAAGLFGAITAKLSILWVQAMPAALAMACVLLAERDPRRRS
ncbi:MAG: DUF1304 domain-containing protein [Aquimonas sp.]|nr:DUF1304 domain-containing protein [Aquimonas sp.]